MTGENIEKRRKGGGKKKLPARARVSQPSRGSLPGNVRAHENTGAKSREAFRREQAKPLSFIALTRPILPMLRGSCESLSEAEKWKLFCSEAAG